MKIVIEIEDLDNGNVAVKSTPSFAQMVYQMQANERHGTSYYYAYCALQGIRSAAKEIDREVKQMKMNNE